MVLKGVLRAPRGASLVGRIISMGIALGPIAGFMAREHMN